MMGDLIKYGLLAAGAYLLYDYFVAGNEQNPDGANTASNTSSTGNNIITTSKVPTTTTSNTSPQPAPITQTNQPQPQPEQAVTAPPTSTVPVGQRKVDLLRDKLVAKARKGGNPDKMNFDQWNYTLRLIPGYESVTVGYEEVYGARPAGDLPLLTAEDFLYGYYQTGHPIAGMDGLVQLGVLSQAQLGRLMLFV